ncbi:YIP1 family protein [Deltaproteobacteria bacterium]|nr:YIP1 family protein [Deltaproteobacteria bacterium]
MEKTEKMSGHGKFSMGRYFQILTRMLTAPGQFFSEFTDDMTFSQPLGCLLISTVFFTGASLLQLSESNVPIAGILFLNAVLMPVITAGITFTITNVSIIKRVTFVKIFSVYAYASSVTLLISWVPLFVWLTEPWKWVLIYAGLTKGCGLTRIHAILILGGTILTLVLFFQSLGLAISHMKGLT